MEHPVIEPTEDIVPASFVYGLLGSIVVGLGLWGAALLFLFG
jgi:hypothetical protein